MLPRSRRAEASATVCYPVRDMHGEREIPAVVVTIPLPRANSPQPFPLLQSNRTESRTLTQLSRIRNRLISL